MYKIWFTHIVDACNTGTITQLYPMILILNDMDKSADIKSEQVVMVGMFPGIYSIYCSLDATSSIAYHNVIEV